MLNKVGETRTGPQFGRKRAQSRFSLGAGAGRRRARAAVSVPVAGVARVPRQTLKNAEHEESETPRGFHFRS